ncbi:esterase-like activity of phytase family protein [bacterium]|nr:esterase-like activity of phytase family protein [bacterium]
MTNRIHRFQSLPLLVLIAGCVSSSENNKPERETQAAEAQVYRFKNLNPVGISRFPREFAYSEGGWSGASRVQPSPGSYSRDEFWTINDRGLNLYLEPKDSTKEAQFKAGDRYFPLPDHQQSIFKIKLNASGQGVVVERLGIRENGIPVNGLPSALANLSTGERGWEIKPGKNVFSPLPGSLQGYDFEGIAQTFDENNQREFWFVEEYGPSILKAGSSGNILKRWSPAPNFKPQSPSLPWALRHRADNRGFEGVAVSGQFIFAAMQSPLSADGGASGEKGHGNPDTPLHRIIRLNKKTGWIEQFAYNHTNESVESGSKHKDVKIGDLAPLDDTGQRFLILEHSDKRKHMVLIEAKITDKTTRLNDTVAYEAGKTPYTGLETRVIANLAPALRGYSLPEKAEGISVLNEKTLLIVFDNDHCIDPLLAGASAPIECENLAVTVTFPEPLFAAK